jgi:hypothetical protein
VEGSKKWIRQGKMALEKVLAKFVRGFFRLYNKVVRYIKDIIIYLTFFISMGEVEDLDLLRHLRKRRNI